MPNNQIKRLTHGAMMIALFVILVAIVFYIPIVGIAATLFAPLSIAWYSAKYNLNASILVAVISCAITFFFGGILILPYSFILASTGIVIGDALRLKKSKAFILMSTGVTILITFAIQYVISIKVFEIDFIKNSLLLMRESYEASIELSQTLTGQTPITTEALDYMFQSLEMLMPSTITLGVFLFALIIISVNLPLLKRFGIQVPKFGDIKNLRLPRSILWYYLITLCINLFARPEFGSTLYIITLNFSMILWVLLTIQGISFLHFCIDELKLPYFLKILTTIMAIPLYSFVLLIGILDLGFDIRSFVKGKIQK